MNEAANLGNFLLAGTQLLSFLVLWRKISGVTETREIRPQPLEVRESERYVTETMCLRQHVEMKTKMEHLEQRDEQRAEALRREMKEDIGGVHSRINDVLRAVSALGGRMDQWQGGKPR